MRTLFAAAIVFASLGPSIATAGDPLFGVWTSADGEATLEILDGFKAGVGPALLIEKGEEVAVGKWRSKGETVELAIGFRTGIVEISGPESFEWRRDAYSRTGPIAAAGRVRLSEDGARFIAAMVSRSWSTSLRGDQSILKTTFSDDSGVVETFDNAGNLASLNAWSVSSDVLKIANNVLIEARISPSYLVGLDDDDDFFVMKAVDELPPPDRTTLMEEREAFLAALVTDSWQTVQWIGVTEHKFRPVEGPLKGRKMTLTDGLLTGSATWEYSPSTGALKIGYSEYTGGLVVNDTLALLQSNGDQVFFKRMPGGTGKPFSSNDVRTIEVSENAPEELVAVLDGQFQRADYFYDFDFRGEGRDGFVHEWRTQPFAVRGQGWSSEFMSDFEVLYEVEDFVVLGEGTVLKRDASPSRLMPKTDAKVSADQVEMEKAIEVRAQRAVVLKITTADGRVKQIRLPVDAMADIAGLEIVIE